MLVAIAAGVAADAAAAAAAAAAVSAGGPGIATAVIATTASRRIRLQWPVH